MSSLTDASPNTAGRGPVDSGIKPSKGSNKAEQKAANEATSGEGPASLSANKKRVPRDKPSITLPLANMTMQKFMTYLSLGISLIFAFYAWRVTVWAHDAGGYWNLMLGRHTSPAVAEASALAAAASSGLKTGTGQVTGSVTSAAQAAYTAPASNIQAQIYALANSLGVKPADLSAAIAPLTDPTAPNPFKHVEELQSKVEEVASQKAEPTQAEPHLGLLGFVEEAFLD